MSVGCSSAISIRFHPKRRASIDHAPGPSKATPAPTAPSDSACHLREGSRQACHTASIAMSVPVSGVHSPTRRSNPRAPGRQWVRSAMRPPFPVRAAAALYTRVVPNTTRMSRSPAPGAPCANVEKRRRTGAGGYATPMGEVTSGRSERDTHLGMREPVGQRCRSSGSSTTGTVPATSPTDSELDNSAFQADHCRLGAILSPQL